MSRIEIVECDITSLEVEAIVNAANSSLLGGGGVDGAIHRAAGKELVEYCRTLNGCKTGNAKISPGFKLKARYVIHTVGPVWNGGKDKEDELLSACYRNSLMLAVENNIRSVAFPAISTGVYRFPAERAAKIAITEVRNFIDSNKAVQKIIFTCFDQRNFSIYSDLLK